MSHLVSTSACLHHWAANHWPGFSIPELSTFTQTNSACCCRMEQFCLFVGKQVSSKNYHRLWSNLKITVEPHKNIHFIWQSKTDLFSLYGLPWAVPVMSRTIALKEKLKVWNIVFVWSYAMSPWRAQPWENIYEECSRQCSHARSQEGSSLPLLLLHLASWAACCVGVSSLPVYKGSFFSHTLG